MSKADSYRAEDEYFAGDAAVPNGLDSVSAQPAAADPAFGPEESVVGALLIGGAWSEVADLVRAADYSLKHRLILQAIEELAHSGEPHDPVTVADRLGKRGHLLVAGGLADLTELARETPSAANVRAYARAVRKKALALRLAENCRPDADALARLKRDISELEALVTPDAKAVRRIALRSIAEIVAERREVEWLGGLDDVLERRVLALLVGPRNSLKSFIALHWAMLAALEGEAVCILSAEGGGLGRRVEAWLQEHAPRADVGALKVLGFERRLNLNSADVLHALRARIDDWGVKPVLTVLDTLSKYSPGVDENDNSEVALYLAGLHEAFVDGYGSTLLAVAHAGHSDAKRPRGASVLMANPDAEYIVQRSGGDGMSVSVTRERFKDSPALGPLAYSAHLVNLGRVDRRDQPITSIALRDAEASAVATTPRTAELRGRAQRQLLAALRAQVADGPGIWTLGDIREVGRRAGMSKATARSAADTIVTTAFMVPSVGGWKLADA